jgi:hypothetical protein
MEFATETTACLPYNTTRVRTAAVRLAWQESVSTRIASAERQAKDQRPSRHNSSDPGHDLRVRSARILHSVKACNLICRSEGDSTYVAVSLMCYQIRLMGFFRDPVNGSVLFFGGGL